MREVTGDKSSYDIYIKNYLNFWAEDKNKDNKMRVNYTMDGLAWYNQNAPLRSAGINFFFLTWLLFPFLSLSPHTIHFYSLVSFQTTLS